MIITRLAGGLGNQMFHYAIARSYQLYPCEQIILDTGLLKELEIDIEKIVQRPYALHVFKNLKADIIKPSLYELFNNTDILTKIKRKIFQFNTTYVIQNKMTPVRQLKLRRKNVFLT